MTQPSDTKPNDGMSRQLEIGDAGTSSSSLSVPELHRKGRTRLPVRLRKWASGDRWLEWVAIFIVAAAPIPLASNRPVFWMVWSAVCFGALSLHLMRLAISGNRLSVSPSSIPLLSIAAILFVFFAVAQSITLPIDWNSMGEIWGVTFGPSISVVPDATLLASIRWASYAVFFFLCLQIAKDRRRAHRLAWITFIVIGLHCALALIGHSIWTPFRFVELQVHYRDSVTGTFINRNSFATFAGMGGILGLSLLMHRFFGAANLRSGIAGFLSGNLLGMGLATVLLFCIWVALAASSSRMGVAAASVGSIVVVAIFILKLAKRSRLGFALFVSGVPVLAAIGFLLFGRNLVERVIFLEADIQSRIHLYAQTMELIRLRPASGFGLDSFEIAFQQVHRRPVSIDLIWDKAHSTYLTLWSEMGLVFGSLPLMVVAAVLLGELWCIIRYKRDIVFAIAAVGVLVQTGLHSIVDFSLENPANIFVFLVILSLAVGRAVRRIENSGSPP